MQPGSMNLKAIHNAAVPKIYNPITNWLDVPYLLILAEKQLFLQTRFTKRFQNYMVRWNMK